LIIMPQQKSTPKFLKKCFRISARCMVIHPACIPLAEKWGGKIREARERVAALINASPEEIVFTSCGTESDNTAIMAAVNATPFKKHVITTRVEHPAVKNMAEYLGKNGYRVTFVPVDGKGRLDLDHLYQSLSDDTAIVSIMWANNETGVIFPVQEISRVLHERGIPFHTDAVQAAGKLPIDVREIKADMLSLSGHKIHAPNGVGVLILERVPGHPI